MRWLKYLIYVIAILAIVYVLGPAPDAPKYDTSLPSVPADASGLEAYVAKDQQAHKIKPGNEARIVWYNDSLKQPTEYAIVYLHGFSASQMEGDPVHREIAKQFGCNLYLARLSQHGIDTTEQLMNLTPDNYWESAKEAYAVAKQLGKKVLLMGTSTGGTLALQLAATYPEIAGLLLISPNIEINNPAAGFANNHWGLQIARMVQKGKYNKIASCETVPDYAKYWNCNYRLEAIVALQELLETTMTQENFKKIQQPVLTLAYYKNEKEQDPVVKVSAMRTMMQAIATPADKKALIEMPNTGNHVQASPLVSKDVDGVRKAIVEYMSNVLKISPAAALN